jgi:hypothetical protein
MGRLKKQMTDLENTMPQWQRVTLLAVTSLLSSPLLFQLEESHMLTSSPFPGGHQSPQAAAMQANLARMKQQFAAMHR